MKRILTRLVSTSVTHGAAWLRCLCVLLAGALAVCALCGARAGNTEHTSRVPNVTGMTLALAQETLRNSHFQPTLSIEQAHANEDSRVTRQYPPAGAVVSWDTRVALIVGIHAPPIIHQSIGPIPPDVQVPPDDSVKPQPANTDALTKVPDVTHTALANAQEMLRDSHLEPTLAGASANEDAQVIAQSVAPGTLVQWNTPVTLTVRKSVPPPVAYVQVPEILSMTPAEAASVVQQAGLSFMPDVANSTTRTIVRQAPVAGTMVPRGSSVSAQSQANTPTCTPTTCPPPTPWWWYLGAGGLGVIAWRLFRRRPPPAPPRPDPRKPNPPPGNVSVQFVTDRPPEARVFYARKRPAANRTSFK